MTRRSRCTWPTGGPTGQFGWRVPLLVVAAFLPLASGCASSNEPRPAPSAAAAEPPQPSLVTNRTVPEPAPTAGTPTLAAIAPTPAVSAEPWAWTTDAGSVPGEQLSTSHYRLFVTLREGSLKTALPTFMETALVHYTSALGPLPEPPRPLKSFVFGKRDQWAEYTKMRLKDDAGTYLALGRGGYTLDGDSVLFDLGRWDTLTLAAHEGWHQYTQATFRHALPIWLEEGVATYMEGHRWNRGEERPTFAPWRNFERFGELREATQAGELISLDELIEGAPQRFLARDGRSKLLTYYAQVWALTHFLAEGENGRYRKALESVLHDAANGSLAGKISSSPHLPPGRPRSMTSRSGRALVLAYFNPDFAEFKKGYEDFVAVLTRRGAGDYVWRGESPMKPTPPKPAG
ncbi:MAG: DUF1570 domain-containing protein [Phycisphaerae bacterium]|nr:DUF1570 domain-containing protein [Phycisphaerae bacterium]